MLTSIRRQMSVVVCAIATATLGVEFSLFGQSAHALGVDLTCSGTQMNTYSPPLTNTNQQINFTLNGTLPNCVSVSTLSTRSGAYQYGYSAPYSCLETSVLSFPNPFNVTYTWSNGRSSTVQYNTFSGQNVEGEFIFTLKGKAISGEFQGDDVVHTLTSATLDAALCTSTGISNVNALVTLTFISTNL